MKTLQFQTGVIGCFLVVFSLAGILLPVPANALTGNMEGSVRYQQEKSAINRDLSAINQHREKIKELEFSCAKFRKAGKGEALNSSRQQLNKAKADLRREKAYLGADKEELLYAYKIAIRAQKE